MRRLRLTAPLRIAHRERGGGGGLELKVCTGKLEGYEFYNKAHVETAAPSESGADSAIAQLLSCGECTAERTARVQSWERVALKKSRRRKKLKRLGLKVEVTEVEATHLGGGLGGGGGGQPSLWLV